MKIQVFRIFIYYFICNILLHITFSWLWQIGWYSAENGLYLNEYDDPQVNNEIRDNDDIQGVHVNDNRDLNNPKIK